MGVWKRSKIPNWKTKTKETSSLQNKEVSVCLCVVEKYMHNTILICKFKVEWVWLIYVAKVKCKNKSDEEVNSPPENVE